VITVIVVNQVHGWDMPTGRMLLQDLTINLLAVCESRKQSTNHIYGYLYVSGKRLHSYGKSPFFMGTSTISMAMFNSKLLVYQRVSMPW
jgi:hypothetical protein